MFPGFRPEKHPAMAEEYTCAIARILEEFGSQQTFDAVTAAIDRGGKFVPTPGEIRDLIALLPTPTDDPSVITIRSEQSWFERIARWFFGVRS